MKNVVFSIICGIVFNLYSCIAATDLSFIDLTISDSVVVKSMRAINLNSIIWLQQVMQKPSTDNKKVYILSIYSDFKTPTPFQHRIQDPSKELILKSYPQTTLRCGLFYNITDQKYFIYNFPSKEQEKQIITQLDVSMTQGLNTTEFIVSSSCDKVFINLKWIYVYSYYYYYDEAQDKWDEGYQWSYAGSFDGYTVLGIDPDFYAVATTQILFLYWEQYEFDYIYQQQTDSYLYQGYTYYQYFFATPIDLADFQHASIAHYYYSSYTSKPWEFSHHRIVILGYKQQAGSYNYSLIFVMDNSQDEETNIIDTFSGQTSQIPKFAFSEDCSKAMVYGNSTVGKPLYDAFYVNYTEQDTEPIQLPSVITKQNCFITMNQNYLYARNLKLMSSGKGNHSAYVFVEHKLYSYFEEKVIEQSQFNNNWLTTFIQLPQLGSQFQLLKNTMRICQLHAFFNRHYYRLQTIGSFDDMQVKEYQTFLEMGFKLNAASPSVSSIVKDFKWVYCLKNQVKEGQDPSITVRIASYNFTTKANQKSEIVLTNKEVIQFKSYMHSKNLSCFYIQNQDNPSLDFYKVDGDRLTLIASLTAADLSTEMPDSQQKIKINQDCTIVKLVNTIYVLNTGTTPAQYEQQKWTFDLAKTSFDENFQFAIQGQSLYKFNGKTYDIVIQTADFKDVNEIIANEDGSKVIVATSNSAKPPETTDPSTSQSSPIKFQLKVFAKLNDIWKELLTQTKLSLAVQINQFIYPLQASSNFSRCVVCYLQQTGKQAPRNECLFKNIDYSAEKTYEVIHQFSTYRYPKIINIQNNYAYMVELEVMTRDKVSFEINCQQRIFGVVQNKFTPLVSYGVDCSYYSGKFFTRKIYEYANLSFHSVIEYIASDKVILMNSTLRNITAINKQFSVNSTNRGFFLTNSTLIQCTPGCLTCYNSYSCLKCFSGYVLNFQTLRCLKCEGFCETCNVKNLTECYTCPLGFFMEKKKNICSKCHPTCESCVGRSDIKCLTCKIGTFLNNNIEKRKKKTCIACPSNCDKCYNTTNCTICKFGYALSTTRTCVQCPLDCLQCKADDVLTCLGCRTGFQLIVGQSKSYCSKCPSFCQTCSNYTCSKCRSGYQLNSKNNVCYQTCLSPCKQCSMSDPSQCTSCIQGYFINGSVCQADISCNAKSNCISCPSTYNLIAKKCYECVLSSNCIECLPDDPTDCISCKRGFYLLGDNCEQCSKDCEECYAPNLCVKCKPGYINAATPNASQCIPCAENCKTCIQSVTNCESCMNGFKLNGSICVTEKVISFTFVLNLEFTSFTNQVYFKVLNDLILISNKSAKEIRISSFKKGSIVLIGGVDVQNTTDETSILSTLSEKLSSGASLGGQEILASKFVGFTPQVYTEDQPKSNLVMIIAIVIPACVIFVGILVLIIYKKFFSVQEVIMMQQPSDKSSTEKSFSQNYNKEPQEAQRKDGFLPKVQRKNKFAKS